MSWMGDEGTRWESFEVEVLCTRVGRQVAGTLKVAGKGTLARETLWKLPPASTISNRPHLTTNKCLGRSRSSSCPVEETQETLVLETRARLAALSLESSFLVLGTSK